MDLQNANIGKGKRSRPLVRKTACGNRMPDVPPTQLIIESSAERLRVRQVLRSADHEAVRRQTAPDNSEGRTPATARWGISGTAPGFETTTFTDSWMPARVGRV